METKYTREYEANEPSNEVKMVATEEIISKAIDSIYQNVVITPRDTGMGIAQLRMVFWALDLLRMAIGVKTAYEIRHGYEPEFSVTASNKKVE